MAEKNVVIYRYEFINGKIHIKKYDFVFDGTNTYRMSDKYSETEVNEFFMGNHISGRYSRELNTRHLDKIDTLLYDTCVMYSLQNDIAHYQEVVDKSLQKTISEVQKKLATLQNTKHRIKYFK